MTQNFNRKASHNRTFSRTLPQRQGPGPDRQVQEPTSLHSNVLLLTSVFYRKPTKRGRSLTHQPISQTCALIRQFLSVFVGHV